TVTGNIVLGIARYAREHNWHLVTDMLETGAWPRDWNGDGILAAMPGPPDELGRVVESGIPCVALSGGANTAHFPRVGPDNRAIGRLAADHLVERGHRSFAWAPFIDDAESRARLEGFRSRLAEHGCTCRVLPPVYARPGVYWNGNFAEHRRSLMGELQRMPRPTGIFAFNDCVAAEIIDAAREVELSVPQDIAVLGAGDAIICTTSAVAISSVDLNLEETGYRAAAVLAEMMNGSDLPARTFRVPPKGIVTRLSTDLIAIADPRVARVLAYIAEHFPNPALTVGSIANAVGMSRRSLERSFRQSMGCTIHQHIVNIRMREALRLLKASPRTKNSDLAALIGVSGERTFFRMFRQHFGMSPKAHRDWANGTCIADRAFGLPLRPRVSAVRNSHSSMVAVRTTAA
ncbi:MAG TPA: DNA-binding transcriptional regulator, partial [Opitutus sp.]|nr:DNA-binding transcriptional regulator [Opitutus sp.]